MSSTEVQLTITPYTPASEPQHLYVPSGANSHAGPAALPSEQALVAAGKALFETLDSWKQGKTYSSSKGPTPYSVKTSSRPKQPGDGAAWHARYSEHKEGTFDDFWELLGKDKAFNERECGSSSLEIVERLTLT